MQQSYADSVSKLNAASKQGGASALVMVIFLGLAAVVLTIAFKLYPVFYEHWQIESVAKSFQEESGLDELTIKEIEKRFKTRLSTNNVREFNFEEGVLITMEDGLLTIDVDYEQRVNMYRNIDALVTFKKLYEKRY